MNSQAAKSAIRAELNSVLKTLKSESIQAQSEHVFNSLISMEKYKKSRRIGVYLSMPLELQTDQIVKHALESGKDCFIPRYNMKEMVMVKLNSLQDFETLPKTKWNIRQPLESEIREDAVEKGGLDLILVPGLGFSERGERLGRGKGYYDRYLHKMDSLRKENGLILYTIGLAFKEQIKTQIPTDFNDYILSQILFKKN